MEATIVYWGYIGIIEKNMEATVVCWGYIGVIRGISMQMCNTWVL